MPRTTLCPNCEAPVSATSERCPACSTRLGTGPQAAFLPTGPLVYFAVGIGVMVLAAAMYGGSSDGDRSSFVTSLVIGAVGFGIMMVGVVIKGVESAIRRTKHD